MNNFKVKCGKFEIANNKPFTLIAGPCQLENEEHAIKINWLLFDISKFASLILFILYNV